ncbi:MAG: hypothetical protein KKH60_04940 [Proteobacteria bacterium]|nr:hypothetical protein [Pseudomonadota bacterium]MBU1137909.1 hypothetical protein [Pseudomonadota bacterium]
MWRKISYLILLLSVLLVSCGGKPLDSRPDNENQGPGLFSGESGTFRILGKSDVDDSGKGEGSEADPE